MLLVPLFCCALISISARAADTKLVPPREGKSETIQLFNGKDLDGWVGNMDLWSVQDGEIVGKNTKPVPVSTYLTTTRKFSDFRIIADVKLVKSDMHSGIAFWGRLRRSSTTNTRMPVTW